MADGRPVRVLMAHTFHHARGGDSTYARLLTRLLEGAGHEVVPLAMRHPDNDPSPWERWFVPMVDFRDLGRRRDRAAALLGFAWNRDARRTADALIRRTRPDVVHLQHVHHHLTPSIVAAARDHGVPVLWTVHDYELVCPSGHLFADGGPCEACKGHRYDQAVRKRCKRGELAPSALAAAEKVAHAAWGLWGKVDRFLCPSAFLAGKLVEFGVPADRVHALPNALLAPEDATGVPGDGWLYAGRLTEEKGVRALAAATRSVPAPLDVCGTGPLEGEVRAAAAPGTRFHGHVPPSALARRVASAGVVVVPSIWWENLPYAVAEAQAAGRAVVASRVGGVPELVDDGVTGVLVPPGDVRALADAVNGLLADPARRVRLGTAARKAVLARMDPERHLAAVLRHYEGVLRSRRAA